jgi:hypothetical protein
LDGFFHLEARQIYLQERTKEKSVYPRSGCMACVIFWVRTSQEYIDHPAESGIIQSGLRIIFSEAEEDFLFER